MQDYETFEAKGFVLESGATLPTAVLAYKTYGTLNAARDNVVVYPTWFPAQHADNEWLIGTGRALDPERLFIVVPNTMGNGLSSSPSNTPQPYDRARFPHVTVRDNVQLQHRMLTERYDVQSIALVTGWSMAGQQAYQWAVSHPQLVQRIAPFCSSARTSPHNFVFLEGPQAALRADSAWANGWYTQPPEAGLRAFGRVFAGWALSQTFYREHLYQQLGYSSLEDFLVRLWEGLFLRRDANNLLALAWTWQHADISTSPGFEGDFPAALQSISARAVVMPGTTDLYFTPEDSQYEVEHMRRATYRPIVSNYGHQAGRGLVADDVKAIDDALRELLAS
jgi:homoserine O-acetyltransferase